MLRDYVGRRRHCPFKAQIDVSYKRFRRRIVQRGSSEAPAASTPLSTGGRCRTGFDFDPVCQRLELDSPPRHRAPEKGDKHTGIQDTETRGGVSSCSADTQQTSGHAVTVTVTARGQSAKENAPQQEWVWKDKSHEHGLTQSTGSADRRHGLQPFAVLDEVSLSLQGESVMKLAAPTLLNDYYTNLLDCSCQGVVALALGSSVYLWSTETQDLVGRLDSSPQPGLRYRWIPSVSSLCWSRDGTALCIGTRWGDVQLWDVERTQSLRRLPSHLSTVRALSWKQQLLSSGSALGRIHHLDPRAGSPLVGSAVQEGGVCSLQWSPGEERLASGSTEGQLCIWDSDVAGVTRSRQPITSMTQPSAVKAMGWCPWQSKTIATGGGWRDGVLRIWDTETTTCVTSANTDSQICSLRWSEKKKYLVTGHGRPQHRVTCWSWDFPSLCSTRQFTGHSDRVLHLALHPERNQIFSVAADQCFHIWDM